MISKNLFLVILFSVSIPFQSVYSNDFISVFKKYSDNKILKIAAGVILTTILIKKFLPDTKNFNNNKVIEKDKTIIHEKFGTKRASDGIFVYDEVD